MFGYEHGVDENGGKTLHIVPEQAEAIRWAADRVLSGWSLSNVAAGLRERGARGVHGGQITAKAVQSIVTNATIAGYRVHRGRVVGRGVWKPILDESTWQAVRTTLSSRRVVRRTDGGTYPVSVERPGGTARRYLLTGGVAVCGVCGFRLVASMKQLRNRDPRPYYLCHPKTGGRGCVGIMADETEALVVAELFDELDRPEFQRHRRRRPRRSARGAHRRVGDLDRQRGELAAMWGTPGTPGTPGHLTTTEWQAARRALAEHEQRLRADLAAIFAAVDQCQHRTRPRSLAGDDVGRAARVRAAVHRQSDRQTGDAGNPVVRRRPGRDPVADALDDRVGLAGEACDQDTRARLVADLVWIVAELVGVRDPSRARAGCRRAGYGADGCAGRSPAWRNRRRRRRARTHGGLAAPNQQATRRAETMMGTSTGTTIRPC